MPPLDGQIRILEIGRTAAVEFTARVFRDFGADVIKVEAVHADARAGGPPTASGRGSATFEFLNTGKRSVALDLRGDDGQAVLRALLERADAAIVDEGYRAVCESLVSDVQRRSGLAVLYLTPFGMSGPHREYEGVPAAVFAAAGESSTLPGGAGYTMFPDRAPLTAAGNVEEYGSAMIGVLSVAAALWRARSDPAAAPVTIDISKQEAEASLNRWLMSHYSASEWVESRATRAYSYGGLAECADGHVMFQTATNHHFAALVHMMGDPAWAKPEQWEDPEYRDAHGAEINERLHEWTKTKTKAELLELALQHGCPVGPFWNAREIYGAGHYRQRGFFGDYARSGADVVAWPRLPFVSGQDLVPLSPPPPTGADTRAVLADVIGLSDEEIQGLIDNGVAFGADRPVR